LTVARSAGRAELVSASVAVKKIAQFRIVHFMVPPDQTNQVRSAAQFVHVRRRDPRSGYDPPVAVRAFIPVDRICAAGKKLLGKGKAAISMTAPCDGRI
jgi:hypothetical protein